MQDSGPVSSKPYIVVTFVLESALRTSCMYTGRSLALFGGAKQAVRCVP